METEFNTLKPLPPMHPLNCVYLSVLTFHLGIEIEWTQLRNTCGQPFIFPITKAC
jgi:hypothetical protein